MGYTSTGRPLYGTGGAALYGTDGKMLYDAQKRLTLKLYRTDIQGEEDTGYVESADTPTITELYNAAIADMNAKTWAVPSSYVESAYARSEIVVETDNAHDPKTSRYRYYLSYLYGYLDTTAYTGDTLKKLRLTLGLDIETAGLQFNLGYFTQDTTAVTSNATWIQSATSIKAVAGLHDYVISVTLKKYLFLTLWPTPLLAPTVPAWESAKTETNDAWFYTPFDDPQIYIT